MTRQPTAPTRRTSIDHYDPELRSVIELRPDARPTTQGRLDGLTVGVKDVVDVAGWATTNGTQHYDDRPATQDAALTRWLRSEGAAIVAKTTLNEFAYGVNGFNPNHGLILNPKDRRRTAGGSSGGSAAAVAAGVVDIGLGTDTSGSVRIPAACCGVYGFAAARGAYDMSGITPLARTFDRVGFITADVADLQRILGMEELPEPSRLRIRRIGTDIEVPPLPQEHWTAFRHDVWEVHGERFTASPDRYGRELQWKLRLERGDLASAVSTLDAWRDRFLAAICDADVLIGPVLDGDAPLAERVMEDHERDEFIASGRLLRHTPTYNQLGWPALTCPTTSGPVQLAARPGGEAAMLAVAASIGLDRSETVTA